jgi:hypothetical protein
LLFGAGYCLHLGVIGDWDTWSAGFASHKIHAESKAHFNGCIEQMLQVARAVVGLKVLHHIGEDIALLPKSYDGWHFSKAAAPGLRALLGRWCSVASNACIGGVWTDVAMAHENDAAKKHPPMLAAQATTLASLASSGAGTALVAAVESAPALRVLLPSCHGFLLSSCYST